MLAGIIPCGASAKSSGIPASSPLPPSGMPQQSLWATLQFRRGRSSWPNLCQSIGLFLGCAQAPLERTSAKCLSSRALCPRSPSADPTDISKLLMVSQRPSTRVAAAKSCPLLKFRGNSLGQASAKLFGFPLVPLKPSLWMPERSLRCRWRRGVIQIFHSVAPAVSFEFVWFRLCPLW